MDIKEISIIDKDSVSHDCSYGISDKDDYGYIVKDILIDNLSKPSVKVVYPDTGNKPIFSYLENNIDTNLMMINDDCIIKIFLRKVHQIER